MPTSKEPDRTTKQPKITAAAARRWQIAHPKPSSTHSMTTRYRASTFRFLDLPAELRNEIYKHALSDPCAIDFDRAKWPNIAMVNHQLLQETLPIFFGINKFRIAIRSSSLSEHNTFAGPMNKYFDVMGKILPKTQAVHRAISFCGNSIVFKHIIFHIKCACCKEPMEPIARIPLCYPQVGPEDWVENDSDEMDFTEAIHLMLSRAAEVNEEHCLKGNFLGWRLEQLCALAACFRYQKDEDTVALAAPQ